MGKRKKSSRKPQGPRRVSMNPSTHRPLVIVMYILTLGSLSSPR